MGSRFGVRTLLLMFLFVVWVQVALRAPSAGARGADRPNVVYLLADDLGWSDISVHPGGTIATPHIDRLFKEGVQLGHFMGWCVCSPTRAMLLTGRHPFRVGTGPECGGELAREETTLAEGFRAHGYRTGVFGKWHNGEDPDTPEYRKAFEEAFQDRPNKKFQGGLGVNEHGFDEAWVYYGGGADYFTRRTVQGRGPVSWWHNREYRPRDEGYTDDLITRHALEFIRENRDRPFFCYVPFHIVHEPLQAKEEDLRAVDPKVVDERKRLYTAMVQALDRNVAAILGELDRLGLRENTIVVFTSDNGATREGSNLPLRGGKHSVYEGGVRLPTVIRWPRGGLVGREWNGLCGSLEMFPTLMAMAGCPMPETRPLDGKNLWPALRDGGPSPVESYYWVWRGEDALRTAEWKLHRFSDRFELYDVRRDEGETRDVAGEHPDVVKALAAKMDAWADSLGAALTHRPAPAKFDARPAPEGEVLEVSVTVTDQARAKDRLIVPFAGWDGSLQATDWVEFDLLFARDSLPRGCFYAPVRGNADKGFEILFKRGEGVDQFGREQVSGPAPRGGPGTWEHRVIGLCSLAPGSLGHHALVFAGGKAGTYKVYLDNLRIRHADGRVSLLWSDGKDTRLRRNLPPPPGFGSPSLRAVPLADLPVQ